MYKSDIAAILYHSQYNEFLKMFEVSDTILLKLDCEILGLHQTRFLHLTCYLLVIWL